MKAINLPHYELQLRDIAAFMDKRSGPPNLRGQFTKTAHLRKDFNHSHDHTRENGSGPEFER
ncbi:MAG: hypothetical protein L0H63_01650 [Nitrococcus sp.]|nr:hypothetical protein [Nitrococcus sp.]